jgi:hypothetical protein
MSVPYKNPISSVQVSTPQSVSRTSVFGTNFSTLSVGGYMEVYNLSDLYLTLTASSYPSLIQLSANTIPIRYTKGNNTFLSPNYLTLNSDNISSGRRRIGMLVYVHETDTVYQYVIPNYDILWNNLSGLTGFSSVTYSDYTTVVNSRSSAGQAFISGWTSSNIEGVSGYTSLNSNWRVFQKGGDTSGQYLPLSGGTVYGPTIFTSGLTANTLNVTGLTQTSGITSTGGITFKQITIDSSYTATTSDYMIDVTGGTFNVTLPSAVGIQGRLLVVKNNGGGAVTVQPVLGQNIDDKPFVILGETNSIQLASNGSNWVAISYNISTVNSSTGVFEFTGLSIASTTTFNVAPVKGWIVDDTTNPLSPQLYYIAYSGGVHTAIYVNTSTETWVYLTSGGTISQSNIELTEQQRRQNIFLGKLGHANKTNIINAFSQPDFVLSPLAQLRDMFVPINLINGGIYASPNGVNLSFNTSAGYLYGLGINFASSTLNPNTLYVSGASPCTFQYRTQTGGTASNTTFIDPLNYDLNGVKTPITGTKATNQRIYLVQNGIFRVQYGQTEYNQLSAAIEGIATEQFNTFSNFTNNGILIGVLSVLSTATDLSDTSKARFFFTSKFGETVGAAGGVSTTTLQQAYNNSSIPEITTNSTLGALSIKNGTGNADNVTNLYEGQNNAGSITSFIRADGLFSGSSVSTPGFTANTNGLTATTISATTYQNLPPPVITGTTNYIPKFTSGTTLTNSLIYDSFSGTGINTATPIAMLDIKLSATTDYILNLKDVSDNDFFRINKAGGIFINTGATAYGAFQPTTPGIYINGDGSTSYGPSVSNRNIITFMQTFTSGAISGIQAATLNYGNVRCGLYFQNNTSPRPELFGTTIVGGTTVETFRITESGSFNIGGLNTDNSRFTIRNSRLTLGSKAFSILNSASTENVFFNDNGNARFNGSLSANTLTVTGTTFNGSGTFTKAGFGSGDVLLDNSSNDSPGLLMYYANNSNYGIDSWNGSFDVLSGQLIRITNNLNESGGAVKMAIDTTGNMVVTGFIKANAWRAGQVINDIILSNSEVTISTTTIATSTSDTDFLTYSYTPLSSTSYLVIHYHLANYTFESGTGNDSYISRIKVDGTEQTYSRQSTVNGNRTGVLFPLTGRYTNTNTTAKSIVVACRRDSADDSIVIQNSPTSMWLRITEIGR